MSASTIRAHNQFRVPPEPDYRGYRCQVAVQAKVQGFQELRVTAQGPQATGTGRGFISVRVGQVLLYLEDRDAMHSWVAAIQRAIELQDNAYGVELPPARIGRRSG